MASVVQKAQPGAVCALGKGRRHKGSLDLQLQMCWWLRIKKPTSGACKRFHFLMDLFDLHQLSPDSLHFSKALASSCSPRPALASSFFSRALIQPLRFSWAAAGIPSPSHPPRCSAQPLRTLFCVLSDLSFLYHWLKLKLLKALEIYQAFMLVSSLRFFSSNIWPT